MKMCSNGIIAMSAKSAKSTKSRTTSTTGTALFGKLWDVNKRLQRLAYGDLAGTVKLSSGTRTETTMAHHVKIVRALKRRYASLTPRERSQPADTYTFMYAPMKSVVRAELQRPETRPKYVMSNRLWRMEWEEERVQKLTLKVMIDAGIKRTASPDAIMGAVLRLADKYEQGVAQHSAATGRDPAQRWGVGKEARRSKFQNRAGQNSKLRAEQRRVRRAERRAPYKPPGVGGLWQLFE